MSYNHACKSWINFRRSQPLQMVKFLMTQPAALPVDHIDSS